MNKLLKKMTIVLIVCASVLYLQVFESVAASGVAIVNHVTAYSIKRHGENYSLGGPVVTVADKKISGKIQILDVMVSEPNTSHAFFVWMVDAISKEPVSKMPYEPSRSNTGLYYCVTEFNISNKPAGDYFIVVEEAREGVLGRFMLRIK